MSANKHEVVIAKKKSLISHHCLQQDYKWSQLERSSAEK